MPLEWVLLTLSFEDFFPGAVTLQVIQVAGVYYWTAHGDLDQISEIILNSEFWNTKTPKLTHAPLTTLSTFPVSGCLWATRFTLDCTTYLAIQNQCHGSFLFLSTWPLHPGLKTSPFKLAVTWRMEGKSGWEEKFRVSPWLLYWFNHQKTSRTIV